MEQLHFFDVTYSLRKQDFQKKKSIHLPFDNNKNLKRPFKLNCISIFKKTTATIGHKKKEQVLFISMLCV